MKDKAADHHPRSWLRNLRHSVSAATQPAEPQPVRHASAASANCSYECLLFTPNGWVPNHPHLPVILYHRALPADQFASPDALADAIDARFAAHGWPPQWRDSVFDFHHYHSTAHEVLAIFSGNAELILGGPGGPLVRVQAGDVLLLPAGTGHCLASRSDDFRVSAGYPKGQQWDLRRDAASTDDLRVMAALPFPHADPLYGAHGPLINHWRAPVEERSLHARHA